MNKQNRSPSTIRSEYQVLLVVEHNQTKFAIQNLSECLDEVQVEQVVRKIETHTDISTSFDTKEIHKDFTLHVELKDNLTSTGQRFVNSHVLISSLC